MVSVKLVTKIVLGVLFIAAGANHFINPAFYENIMPSYLPWHYALVIISGVAEVVLGVGLLIPKTSRYSAWGLILLLIAIFPANIHMATHPELYPNIPPIALWIRLPIQLLLILWAYWYTLRSNRIYESFRR
ncbi:MAG: DoxX family membrane protein [Chloracidobacterium sp.]|nr:DoxX family membrane protein [Chloracidobacterium sp.]